MSDDSFDLSNLDDAIVAVYRGSPDDFVRRRDALAKQLRAEKRREDADRVKALRKPSRSAWALNNVLAKDAAPIDQLAAALQAAQEAQSSGGAQLRTALENVRLATREVAHAAASASIRAEQPVDATTLVAAVNAVIGNADAFAALRAGLLTEIPEAGGLDFLTSVSLPQSTATTVSEPTPSRPVEDDTATRARAQLVQAEAARQDARARARDCDKELADAKRRLDAAEQQLERARIDADARRAELERAQKNASDAAADLQQAEQVVADLH